MSRLGELFMTFFTGIVKDVSDATLEEMKADWNKLTPENQADCTAKIDKRSTSRRQSMFETAGRSNSLLIGAALAGTAIATLAAPDTNSVVRGLLVASVTANALSIITLVIAISAKVKVMKPPRKGEEVEPAAMLKQALSLQNDDEANSGAKAWSEFVLKSQKHHKRKIVLLVERRAQCWAAYTLVVGIIAMVVGLYLR